MTEQLMTPQEWESLSAESRHKINIAWKHKESIIAQLVSERDVLEDAIKNALANEGQDGCLLDYIDHCDCWRCKARAALAKVGAK